jgi:hypothetical protein
MTVEQDSILASLRQHAFAAEADLAKLLKLRNVPTPRLLSSYEDSDDNEWNEAWKDVIMRRRYHACLLQLLIYCLHANIYIFMYIHR